LSIHIGAKNENLVKHSGRFVHSGRRSLDLAGGNILPGSFMTGQIQWAINGVFCVIVGAAYLYFANRRKSEKK